MHRHRTSLASAYCLLSTTFRVVSGDDYAARTDNEALNATCEEGEHLFSIAYDVTRDQDDVYFLSKISLDCSPISEGKGCCIYGPA